MLISRDVGGKPAGVAGLGIIPSWQFSMDPKINPKINPNVKFPDGVFQTTVQPLGPYFSGLGETSVGTWTVPLWLRVLSMASSGVSAYYGYKGTKSIGWAIGWGLLGGIFPAITPAIAYSKYGKK